MAEPNPLTQQERSPLVEKLLNNRAFHRLFEALETYQQLLHEGGKDLGQSQIMRQRMHDIFGAREGMIPEVQSLRERALEQCEQNELSKESLAEQFAALPEADKFSKVLDPKPGNIDEHGGVMLNEVARYNLNGDTLSLSLVMNNYTGDEVWSKYLEGLRLMGAKIKAGELPEVKTITRSSWLYTSIFRKKMEEINGNDLEKLEDADEKIAKDVQYLALTSNKRTLREFLTTGKLPEVKTLNLTREEFVGRFGG